MHWYGGSIAEAVALSKQRNAIFVVFVEGDNEQSTEMAATIDDSTVLKRLSDKANFLAIKLKSGSENYTHFVHIYQLVPVPSLFFIGHNGTPLEVVCAGVEPDNLASRMDRILIQHRRENRPNIFPSTSSQNIKEETENLMQAEAAAGAAAVAPKVAADAASKLVEDQPETSSGPSSAKIRKTVITKSGKEYEVVCEGDVCVRRPEVKPGDPGPSRDSAPVMEQEENAPVATAESTASMEEKMERAKEMIEARRREKAEKEKELEKQKEMERRAAGQGVAELKRWQAEQELKQIQEERKREKMENDMARQRILEQIAQDRAERKARDAPAPVPQPSHAPPASEQTASRPVAPSGDGSPRARIQFKLPDGTSHTAHFDADGTLADVQRYVADNLQLSASSFSLWTAFPRRELTETDATLRRLELAPSAALLVLPRRVVAAVASPSSFSALISFFTQILTTLVLTPSQQLVAWVRALLVPAPRTAPAPPASAPAPAAPRAPTPPAGLRRRGNIHRLPGERAGDDDNNTWNGNSTQQM